LQFNFKRKQNKMTQTVQERKDQVHRNAQTFKRLTGKEAMALRTQDPVQYAELRAAAVEAGVITGANGYRQPGLHASHYVETKPAITTEEIRARIAWPKETVEKFYRNQGNENPAYDLAKLARENPTAYESIRLAAQSYSIIERGERQPQRKPIDEKPAGSTNPIILGDRLGKLAGLPAGTEVTADQYFELVAHADALDAAKVKA
jgi:hypothetical protein